MSVEGCHSLVYLRGCTVKAHGYARCQHLLEWTFHDCFDDALHKFLTIQNFRVRWPTIFWVGRSGSRHSQYRAYATCSVQIYARTHRRAVSFLLPEFEVTAWVQYQFSFLNSKSLYGCSITSLSRWKDLHFLQIQDGGQICLTESRLATCWKAYSFNVRWLNEKTPEDFFAYIPTFGFKEAWPDSYCLLFSTLAGRPRSIVSSIWNDGLQQEGGTFEWALQTNEAEARAQQTDGHYATSQPHICCCKLSTKNRILPTSN